MSRPEPVALRFRQSASRRAVILAACIAAGLALVISAWAYAPDNPRDGWSWANIAVGNPARSPSGDWAYFELQLPRVAATIGEASQVERVMVLKRRARFGLFRPWLQTEDLRFIDLRGQTLDWQSGTTNPTWPAMLAAVRGSVAGMNLDAAYRQRVTAAIDAEIAGAFPRRTVRWRPLALDALFLAAHLVLAVGLVGLAWLLIRAARSEGRWLEGRCPICGYDATGIEGPCPECGHRASRSRPRPTTANLPTSNR